MATNKPSISLDMADKYIPNQVSAVIGTDDREARSKFWIAVYTRPRSEKKAASELTKSGVEIYLPIQKQLRKWSDRKKYVDVPIIPMIIFAKISDDEIQRIKSHPLIINILSYPGVKVPAHIPAIQIDNLKYLLNQSDISVSFEQGHFETDDLVMIVRGNLKGLTGQVRNVKDNMTELWMSIDLLGGAVMRINSSDVEHYKR